MVLEIRGALRNSKFASKLLTLVLVLAGFVLRLF